MTKEELIERESQVGRRCAGKLKPGVREQLNTLLEQGKDEEAGQLNISGRKPCGYNMNEIFLEGPLDGELHDYKCPKCGVEGTYRAAGPIAE